MNHRRVFRSKHDSDSLEIPPGTEHGPRRIIATSANPSLYKTDIPHYDDDWKEKDDIPMWYKKMKGNHKKKHCKWVRRISMSIIVIIGVTAVLLLLLLRLVVIVTVLWRRSLVQDKGTFSPWILLSTNAIPFQTNQPPRVHKNAIDSPILDSNLITTTTSIPLHTIRDPIHIYKTRKLQIPIQDDSIQIGLQPSLGTHTYTQDAIFAIANTNDFETYVLFLTTLRQSGFQGDVVLSIPSMKTLSKPLLTFLKDHSHHGLILYEDVLRLETNDGPVLVPNDSLVYLKGVYHSTAYDVNAIHDTRNHSPPSFVPLEDLRPPRTLGLAKLELYWIWSKQYSSTSHILLMDTIHDVYFQQGAQIGIGLRRVCTNAIHYESSSFSYELHLYEEKQQKNRRVLHAPASTRNGEIIYNTYGHKTILSPLSTHGHQKSIEIYLRAMIQRFDDTHCVKYQCQWAFHNHLYYSGMIKSLPGIDKVLVHLQGTFAVNSVGWDVPLRSSPLVRDVNDTFTIINRPMGEGIYPSWAVHQYIQDPELHAFIQQKKELLVKELEHSSLAHFGNLTVPTTVNDLKKWNLDDTIKPVLGKHRPDKDAIFTVLTTKRKDSEAYIKSIKLLISSARKSGFDGDIVLHIPNGHKDLVDFFNAQVNIVVYEGLIKTLPNGSTVSLLRHSHEKDEAERDVKVIAFDIYLLWTQQYDPTSSVMILDGEDVNFVQSNPFVTKSCYTFEIHFYSEHVLEKKFSNMVDEDDSVSDKMMNIITAKGLDRLQEEKVIIPHALFGHIEVVQSFVLDMLDGFDKLSCFTSGCDWAIINYLWYGPLSRFGKGINYKMTSHNQGTHVIHPIYTSDHDDLASRGLYDEILKVYKNWDGSISPVVMRYHP